jgi:hypothetical protein
MGIHKGIDVVWLVETLCYKPEGRGFNFRCHCMSSIYLTLSVALGSGVYSTSNRNEFQRQKNNVSGE